MASSDTNTPPLLTDSSSRFSIDDLSRPSSPIPSLASYTAMTATNHSMNNSNNSSSSSSWLVHKFGGTSLACADCYRLSASIIIDVIQKNKKILPPHQQPRIAVVVSAMGEVKTKGEVANLIKKNNPSLITIDAKDKVTNLLIKATTLAAQQDIGYKTIIQQLEDRHLSVIDDLLHSLSSDSPSILSFSQQLISELKESIRNDLTDFSNILRGVWLSKRVQEEGVQGCWWFGYGELWSHKIMSAYLKLFAERINNSLSSSSSPSSSSDNDRMTIASLDARDVVILQKQADIVPDYAVSEKKLQKFLSETNANIIVITGYIATSASGFPTTLGRDGSDYSASIFAALLKANTATIWTDVDGVYSANPSQVKEAVVLDELSYDEASELAYFGAKVIHPKTMTPVVFHKIPIWIRNTFRSYHPGTCIRAASEIAMTKRNNTISKPLTDIEEKKSLNDSTIIETKYHSSPMTEYTMSHGVKGFSEIGNLALIRVEGTGMVGVSGVAYRLFGALRSAAFSVILITQAGSEHSICIALPLSQGDMGVQLIRREFRQELENGDIQTVDMSGPSACLAVVGDGMRHTMGVAGRFFSALAQANVNVQAIAQGGSERNISAIISQNDVANALTAVHNAFLTPK